MRSTLRQLAPVSVLAAVIGALAAAPSAQACPGVQAANWSFSADKGNLGGTPFMISGLQGNFLAAPACSFSGADYAAAPIPPTVSVVDYGQGSNWSLTFAAPIQDLYVYMCFWRAGTYTFDQPFTLASGAAGSSVVGQSLVVPSGFASGILHFNGITTLNVVDTGACCPSQQLTFSLQPPCATETVRPGTPPNPIALMPGVTTPPLIGSLWDPVIDHTTFLPAALLDLLVVGLAGPDIPSTYGTILLDPLSFLLYFPASGPGVPFQVPIPPDPSLSGLSLSTQGVSIDGASTTRLTNALDIVIG